MIELLSMEGGRQCRIYELEKTAEQIREMKARRHNFYFFSLKTLRGTRKK